MMDQVSITIQKHWRGYFARKYLSDEIRKQFVFALRYWSTGGFKKILNRSDLQDLKSQSILMTSMYISSLPSRPLRSLPPWVKLKDSLKGFLAFQKELIRKDQRPLTENSRQICDRRLMFEEDKLSVFFNCYDKTTYKLVQADRKAIHDKLQREYQEELLRNRRKLLKNVVSRLEDDEINQRVERERMLREELSQRRAEEMRRERGISALQREREMMIQEEIRSRSSWRAFEDRVRRAGREREQWREVRRVKLQLAEEEEQRNKKKEFYFNLKRIKGLILCPSPVRQEDGWRVGWDLRPNHTPPPSTPPPPPLTLLRNPYLFPTFDRLNQSVSISQILQRVRRGERRVRGLRVRVRDVHGGERSELGVEVSGQSSKIEGLFLAAFLEVSEERVSCLRALNRLREERSHHLLLIDRIRGLVNQFRPLHASLVSLRSQLTTNKFQTRRERKILQNKAIDIEQSLPPLMDSLLLSVDSLGSCLTLQCQLTHRIFSVSAIDGSFLRPHTPNNPSSPLTEPSMSTPSPARKNLKVNFADSPESTPLDTHPALPRPPKSLPRLTPEYAPEDSFWSSQGYSFPAHCLPPSPPIRRCIQGPSFRPDPTHKTQPSLSSTSTTFSPLTQKPFDPLDSSISLPPSIPLSLPPSKTIHLSVPGFKYFLVQGEGEGEGEGEGLDFLRWSEDSIRWARACSRWMEGVEKGWREAHVATIISSLQRLKHISEVPPPSPLPPSLPKSPNSSLPSTKNSSNHQAPSYCCSSDPSLLRAVWSEDSYDLLELLLSQTDLRLVAYSPLMEANWDLLLSAHTLDRLFCRHPASLVARALLHERIRTFDSSTELTPTQILLGTQKKSMEEENKCRLQAREKLLDLLSPLPAASTPSVDSVAFLSAGVRSINMKDRAPKRPEKWKHATRKPLVSEPRPIVKEKPKKEKITNNIIKPSKPSLDPTDISIDSHQPTPHCPPESFIQTLNQLMKRSTSPPDSPTSSPSPSDFIRRVFILLSPHDLGLPEDEKEQYCGRGIEEELRQLSQLLDFIFDNNLVELQIGSCESFLALSPAVNTSVILLNQHIHVKKTANHWTVRAHSWMLPFARLGRPAPPEPKWRQLLAEAQEQGGWLSSMKDSGGGIMQIQLKIAQLRSLELKADKAAKQILTTLIRRAHRAKRINSIVESKSRNFNMRESKAMERRCMEWEDARSAALRVHQWKLKIKHQEIKSQNSSFFSSLFGSCLGRKVHVEILDPNKFQLSASELASLRYPTPSQKIQPPRIDLPLLAQSLESDSDFLSEVFEITTRVKMKTRKSPWIAQKVDPHLAELVNTLDSPSSRAASRPSSRPSSARFTIENSKNLSSLERIRHRSLAFVSPHFTEEIWVFGGLQSQVAAFRVVEDKEINPRGNAIFQPLSSQTNEDQSIIIHSRTGFISNRQLCSCDGVRIATHNSKFGPISAQSARAIRILPGPELPQEKDMRNLLWRLVFGGLRYEDSRAISSVISIQALVRGHITRKKCFQNQK